MCRCCRGFRFRASGFPYSFPAILRVLKIKPTMHFYTHNATLYSTSVFKCVLGDVIICIFVLLFYEYTMVENIVHVTADYEASLARSGYVPRFSYGRRMLRDDGDPNNPTAFSS